jgi:S-adenosylmethionine-diacylgycerolhomoserine-N-methlytransferase
MTDAHAALHMDRMYRHQRVIYDATRAYYLLGRDQMLRELDAGTGVTVLEIACGTARNLLRAAGMYPKARFYGVDISSEMLTTARASVAKSPHTHRIWLGLADATDFDAKAVLLLEQADRVLISYALSMIPRWESALDEAVLNVGPGGSLHIVDFGKMDGMPAPAKRALVAWLAKFDVTPRRNLEAVCRAAAVRNGMSFEFRESPRGYWASVVMRRPVPSQIALAV